MKKQNSQSQRRSDIKDQGLIALLDREDLKKRPQELRLICESLFYNGKGLRPQLVSLVGAYIGLKPKERFFLSRLIEYIHNSSLLHDDFIDHTKKRHNKKSAWFEFSPAQAVLTGDYLLSKVNLYLAKEGNLELLKATAQVICNLAEGEFLQRQFLNFKNKNLKKRNQVSEFKTGSLFKWCLQAPFIYKKEKNKKIYSVLEELSSYLGILFQSSDDLLDFNVRNHSSKPCLIDIKETYFNSFACFLLKQASPQQEEQLKNVKSLLALSKIFPDFQERVKKFDKLNQKLIQKTEKLLDQKLAPLLKKKKKAFLTDLKKLISYFYWRK